jgi:hypothetical protein
MSDLLRSVRHPLSASGWRIWCLIALLAELLLDLAPLPVLSDDAVERHRERSDLAHLHPSSVDSLERAYLRLPLRTHLSIAFTPLEATVRASRPPMTSLSMPQDTMRSGWIRIRGSGS